MQGFRLNPNDYKLDPNWVHLMLAAKQIGISVDEIRQFLRQSPSAEEEPSP
ncbi:anti-repressor SinI family protein [Paenibacillus hodogayensis]|uniref:Anti-repressor SinI family protein n=1 Tax=Paenibacillus hodogayensis TaxID=279208 RepID=A0ABV5VZQ1_9BACL